MKYIRGLALASSALYLVNALPSLAQTAQPLDQKEQEAKATDQAGGAEGDQKKEDIVVTGTLIRGVAPAGTNVVGLTRDDIITSGASSTSQLLERVTQGTNFNNTLSTAVGNTGAAISTVSANLRGIGGSGGSGTLTLVDGHRVVGVGILQTIPDPNTVPPGVTERVEVVPDGGSSLYGADAVGGVINIITRRRVDGVEANARYGFADNYHVIDLDGTAGKQWADGSIYVSYAFSKHDALFGRDRGYVRQITPSNSCAPGTITVGNPLWFLFGGSPPVTYRLPDRTPGTVAQCDPTKNASLFPEETRHSVFAGVSQDFGRFKVDVRGFYTSRVTHGYSDQRTGTVTITNANPYFQPIGTETSQSVALSFAPAFGLSAHNDTELSTWGITPTITMEAGGDWQVKLMGNLGRSTTEAHQQLINSAALAAAGVGTTTATALNPYVVSQTNAAVLAAIGNAEDFGLAKQGMDNVRLVADGTLVQLPGGRARLAVGAEYLRETFDTQRGTVLVTGGVPAPKAYGKRTVKAVFGELSLPVFGEDNGGPGMESLVFSASGRYDDYSDFGHTFNPKLGLTYKPFDWISLRGAWGKSFTAPSLADTTGSVDTRLSLGQSFIVRPGDSAAGRPTIILAGGNPGLKPQKANIYSLGADIEPYKGLRFSATYWNIDLKDQIATPAFTWFVNTPLFYSALTPFYILNPTQQQVQDIVTSQGITTFENTTSVAAIFAGPAPYQLVDLRRANLGRVKLDGIDFSAGYVATTGFGSINASLSGTYNLRNKTAATQSSPFSDALFGSSRLRLTGSLGASISDFRAQVTWNHSHGFDVLPASYGGQTHISSFNVFDLFFSYDFKRDGLLKDTTLTLNVNNVFDQDPPFANTGSGYTNGSTLGRLIQLGIRKKI